MSVYSSFFQKLFVCLLVLLFFSCKEKQAVSETNHKFTNALATETSPYLLQHAHNPVNWRPWSQEALDEAKREDKLVLVSIGYSSCHWCHVMEAETFENEEVAKVMNDHFINIKVDREERPDIDQVYMTALQLMTGNGGWPLNVITLPNGKPLYGGTYHTKEQWTQVLTKISELYKNDPAKAAEYSNMVADGIAQANIVQPTSNFENLTKETLGEGVVNWKPFWDLEKGGDQGTQKFMLPSNLDFLMDYAVLAEDEGAKTHIKNTLDQMARGGVYDHVGGGFYRYSTDGEWRIPHFEKMLYDNAQAISLFSKGYLLFKEPAYKALVLETITFLDREMKAMGGGYHAAIDADSEGEEGKFYLWKEPELRSVLEKEFDLFAAYFNVLPETTWEEGNYVLRTLKDDVVFAEEHDISVAELDKAKMGWKQRLLAARDQRIRPRSDDKIITSWNALLINGLVASYKAFGAEEHLGKAEAIFDFLKSNSYKDQALVHTYKEGSKQKEGFLEDYAFLIDACLQLYGATGKQSYLDFAQQLTTAVQEHFSDDSGMFRYNKNTGLIATIIKTDDGVLPSPNAVMADNLYQMGHIRYDTEMTKKAKEMVSSMTSSVVASIPSYARWAKVLMQSAYPFYEIAVVGPGAEVLAKELFQNHLPNTLQVASVTESDLPLFKGRYLEDDTYIFVCQNQTCKLPVTTTKEALEQLNNF